MVFPPGDKAVGWYTRVAISAWQWSVGKRQRGAKDPKRSCPVSPFGRRVKAIDDESSIFGVVCFIALFHFPVPCACSQPLDLYLLIPPSLSKLSPSSTKTLSRPLWHLIGLHLESRKPLPPNVYVQEPCFGGRQLFFIQFIFYNTVQLQLCTILCGGEEPYEVQYEKKSPAAFITNSNRDHKTGQTLHQWSATHSQDRITDSLFAGAMRTVCVYRCTPSLKSFQPYVSFSHARCAGFFVSIASFIGRTPYLLSWAPFLQKLERD